MKDSFFICKIWQNDSFHFSIEWNDGIIQKFRLSNLQKLCSCANCKDESTGKALLDPESVHENVQAKTIRNVGRYGIQIKFTTGCSSGIYNLADLRKMECKQ